MPSRASHASHLALLGGEPVRREPFPRYNAIGAEEKRAANEVLDSGLLSQFLGTRSEGFLGGSRVRTLESDWAAHFGVKHAVSVNSATSGLYAALAAARIGPGDEVIVSPYTMSASVTGALLFGATPVFADIDPETYCLSPASIRAVLSPRTRAIVAVDLFGHPIAADEIRAIAAEHRLVIVEDAAQAPGGAYKGTWAGRLGHVGVFSLNYHKTIHCGEGGMVVTDDDDLAERVRLVRNHGEAVVKPGAAHFHPDIIGFNFRMTELESAIATEQLKKLEALTEPRIEAADFLRKRWDALPGLHPATVAPDCRHVYYVFAMQYDAATVGVSRERFIEAVRAEGVPLIPGYVEPLYLQPLYQARAFACGPNCTRYEGAPRYERGLCPVAEAMHDERLIYTDLVHAGLSRADLEDVAGAVEKVVLGAKLLR